jgi:hypothetical protein
VKGKRDRLQPGEYVEGEDLGAGEAKLRAVRPACLVWRSPAVTLQADSGVSHLLSPSFHSVATQGQNFYTVTKQIGRSTATKIALQ